MYDIRFDLWYPDPSISLNVTVSTQYDMGVGVGSLLDTSILLWVWLFDFFNNILLFFQLFK